MSNEVAPPDRPDTGDTEKPGFRLSSMDLSLRRRMRHLSDRAAQTLITIGGIGVIITILLIFLYLFYEVIPLFRSAGVSGSATYTLADGGAETLHLAIEEQTEIGMRLNDSGVVSFFNLEDGAPVEEIRLPVPDGTEVTAFGLDSEESGLFMLGLSDGRALVAQYEYTTTYAPPDNTRVIRPGIGYPYGEDPIPLLDGDPLTAVAIRSRGDALVLSAVAADGTVSVARAEVQRSIFAAFSTGGSSTVNIERFDLDVVAPETEYLYFEGDARWLYLITDRGLLRLLDVQAMQRGAVRDFGFETFLTDNRARLTHLSLLLGGISLLVADESGNVGQWALTRNEDSTELTRIRNFNGFGAPVTSLAVEQRRKNFLSADSGGRISIYNTTAERTVYSEALLSGAVQAMAVSPRGDALLVEAANGELSVWDVDNEHPEVSWAALWNRIWYEGYSQPEYVWQSTGATNEFEPKYSLMPLSFGTLKAAFYAMLLATPLAICGAIYTGYFMAPAMRRKVKPLIELMQALPTVVLGFLAGLWLAPFLENNLLSVLSMLVLLPLSIVLASLLWLYLPKKIRHAVAEGWEGALLIPVVVLFGYLSFLISGPLESWLFAGDIRFWLSNDLGISYDQRNAMVVGFAMGFAVIPTIFSISEDAIFQVPRQLSYGSLALGATPWQTMYRVVLPTASPGIFSATMIGMGRAVGETMIVLMATGNTPIMDVNIFEGMRTLAANIAVEVPESEVDSTHYRILFLAALVLFIFTFVINTAAELIRQRLRVKYSTL